MTEAIKTLRQWIAEARAIVFFGGAGVSTASGIPDFRGTYGLYQQDRGKLPPYEEMLSIGYFRRRPDDFWQFYRDVLLHPDAQPNEAHRALARLEKQKRGEGGTLSIVTQNIDGLHQAAGSETVHELHGTALSNRCLSCRRAFTLPEVLAMSGTPRCECGGLIRPEIVMYGETLPPRAVAAAEDAIAACDLLIVGGTSLVVYPAAGMVRYRPRAAKLALLNRDETPMDGEADVVIRDPISETLAQAVPA